MKYLILDLKEMFYCFTIMLEDTKTYIQAYTKKIQIRNKGICSIVQHHLEFLKGFQALYEAKISQILEII